MMMLLRSCVHSSSWTRSSRLLRIIWKPVARVQTAMASTNGQFGSHASAGTKYGSDGVDDYRNRPSHSKAGLIFVDPVIDDFLKSEVPNKKVLDIGCGPGDWSRKAAQFGAKRVDGFDYDEEMVKAAKQTTSQCDNVHIRVGSAAEMPYSDNEFDVAMSLFVTNNLSMESFSRHFEELYRVLAPGGKSMVYFPTDPAAYTLQPVPGLGIDPVVLQTKLDAALGNLPNHPMATSNQIVELLKGFPEVMLAFFKFDKNGKYSVVMEASELCEGQKLWAKTDNLVIPNFFYSRCYYDKCISAAGLQLERSEHGFTIERQEAYNRTKKPEERFTVRTIPHPPVIAYHITKPV